MALIAFADSIPLVCYHFHLMRAIIHLDSTSVRRLLIYDLEAYLQNQICPSGLDSELNDPCFQNLAYCWSRLKRRHDLRDRDKLELVFRMPHPRLKRDQYQCQLLNDCQLLPNLLRWLCHFDQDRTI